MNQASQFILNLYHYSVLIRDTLEYTFYKESFDRRIFEIRKNALKRSLEENGQMRKVLDKIPDNGKIIIEKLNDFLDQIYGPESTIIRQTPTELRVDHAQHQPIFEMVVGLHQTIVDITNSYNARAQERKDLDIVLSPLLSADERLYRSIALISLMTEIEKIFAEFQKAMRESKGQPSPQSNYILGDLTKLIQFVMFLKAHNKVTDTIFNNMLDANLRVIDMVQGKRELPEKIVVGTEPDTVNPGILVNGVLRQSFKEVFSLARESNRMVLSTSEKIWKDLYIPITKELQELHSVKQDLPNPGPVGAA
jgi:hypothetical protein